MSSISGNDVSSPEKGWRSETSDQSQESQLLCENPTLQNGGDSHTKGSSEEIGLANKDRSQGCILLYPDTSGPQKASVFPGRSQSIPIQLPPLRAGTSSLGL